MELLEDSIDRLLDLNHDEQIETYIYIYIYIYDRVSIKPGCKSNQVQKRVNF